MSEHPMFQRGHAARMHSIEVTACPWYSGGESADLSRVLGQEHPGEPPALECPWCAGWRAAERELYLAAKRGKR